MDTWRNSPRYSATHFEGREENCRQACSQGLPLQVATRDWTEAMASPFATGSSGSDEVEVWLAVLPNDPECLIALSACLSPDELQRAARFRAEEPRRRFMFGRAILRQLLGASLGLAPAAVVLGQEPRGKPFLRSPAKGRALHFNLLHADAHVAIVLSRGRRVGVDIESFHRLEDWPAVAERIFSPSELTSLHSMPVGVRRAAFFRGWTSKEAYLKATGDGLSDAIRSIEVSVVPGDAPQLLAVPGDPDAIRRWAIRAVPMPEGMTGAVVFEVSAAAVVR
jgi:4'-phosphopantetheinyl transferase